MPKKMQSEKFNAWNLKRLGLQVKNCGMTRMATVSKNVYNTVANVALLFNYQNVFKFWTHCISTAVLSIHSDGTMMLLVTIPPNELLQFVDPISRKFGWKSGIAFSTWNRGSTAEGRIKLDCIWPKNWSMFWIKTLLFSLDNQS